MQAVALSQSVGYGSGYIKKEDFFDFLEQLNGSKKQVVGDVKGMKEAGLPIEET